MSKLAFRVHAIQRMFERDISREDVSDVVQNGEVIQNYPDDKPYPSYLMLGWRGERPMHIVAARNETDDEIIIITVYEPDPKRWEPGFKTKKDEDQ